MKIDVTIKIKNGEKHYNIYKTRDKGIILENQDCEGTPVSEKQIFDILDKFYREEFSLMAESMMARGCVSENKAEIVPVKGQEFHIYTGVKPSVLDEKPCGVLLCKAIFGESVPIIASGKASYGLLVKNNQYIAIVDIDTIHSTSKRIFCVDMLDFHQGAIFTIYNW